MQDYGFSVYELYIRGDKERQSKIIARDKPCLLQFNTVFGKWFYCFSFFLYAKFCPPFVPRKYHSKKFSIDIQRFTQYKYRLRGEINILHRQVSGDYQRLVYIINDY